MFAFPLAILYCFASTSFLYPEQTSLRRPRCHLLSQSSWRNTLKVKTTLWPGPLSLIVVRRPWYTISRTVNGGSRWPFSGLSLKPMRPSQPIKLQNANGAKSIRNLPIWSIIERSLFWTTQCQNCFWKNTRNRQPHRYQLWSWRQCQLTGGNREKPVIQSAGRPVTSDIPFMLWIFFLPVCQLCRIGRRIWNHRWSSSCFLQDWRSVLRAESGE